MKEQSLKSHAQYVPGYHFITSFFVLAVLILSILFVVKQGSEQLLLGVILLFVSASLLGIFWYARVFALKAQDRAIRAEENFRYFVLTGKPLPSSLRMSQIIALRFASNEEYLALVDRAVAEKLPSKEIKAAIQSWRPDYHRA